MNIYRVQDWGAEAVLEEYALSSGVTTIPKSPGSGFKI